MATIGRSVEIHVGVFDDTSVPEQPTMRADDVVDIAGVNIHFSDGYTSASRTIACLDAIGFRHVRAEKVDPNGGTQATNLAALGATGRFDSIAILTHAGTAPTANPADRLTKALTWGIPIRYLEGCNEPNNDPTITPTTWPATLSTDPPALQTRDVFGTILTTQTHADMFDARTAAGVSIPIIASAMSPKNVLGWDDRWLSTGGSVAAYVDGSAVHHYPGGRSPWKGSYLTSQLSEKAISAGPGKPKVITEYGYNNTPDDVWSVYIARSPFDLMRAGVAAWYYHELIDRPTQVVPGERVWGLFTWDGTNAVIKQPGTTLARLFALYNDPAGAAMTPKPLRYSATGSAQLLTHCAQLSDGTYLVALWRDVEVWNVAQQARVTINPVDIRVTWSRIRTVEVWNPHASAAIIATGGGTSITVPVAGETVILHVT